MKYLSRKTHKNMGKLLVKKNWILITRSGTVGRVGIVTSQWDGWAATEDLYRVVLKDTGLLGYIAAFLGSDLGRVQLTQRPFGAVIDHLTEADIRNVRIPLPATAAQRAKVKRIAEQAMKAATGRGEAAVLAIEAEKGVSSLIPTPEAPVDDEPLGLDDRVKIAMDPEDALRKILRAK